LREERGLRVFENRVLGIFGPKRDEVTGDAEIEVKHLEASDLP